MRSIRIFSILSIIILASCTKDEASEVTIEELSADFSFKATAKEGEAVIFTDQSSGNPTSWNWEFEGGTPATSTAQTPRVTFSSAGSYNISLTVAREDETSSASKSIEVMIEEIFADFSASKTEVIAGNKVTFNDQSSGNPTAWSWSFNGANPASSTDQNPEVIYSTSGMFDVSLEASKNASSESISMQDYIIVSDRNITSPPFSGTIFEDPDIITSSDPTTYLSAESKGQETRTMFDRRVNDWITVDAHLINATFEGDKMVEVQVNPEFTAEQALEYAIKYSEIIGRIPNQLMTDVETVWIHDGLQLFGGGNKNILIHVDQADKYENDGIIEEVLVHEASHTSLDEYHAESSDWIAAQNQDPTFISTYALDNPAREDVAESFLLYLAVKYRSDRISDDLYNIVLATMPNRIRYFNKQNLDMYPIAQ